MAERGEIPPSLNGIPPRSNGIPPGSKGRSLLLYEEEIWGIARVLKTSVMFPWHEMVQWKPSTVPQTLDYRYRNNIKQNPLAHRPEGRNEVWSFLQESQLLELHWHFSPVGHPGFALCLPQALFPYCAFSMFNHPYCFKAVHSLLFNLFSLHYQWLVLVLPFPVID